ncbi:MAG: hypothetical protein L0Z54_06245, partial [Thermoplasmata archaeon]|nr:hypothetical protein [Thermoplasmata archaeon]
PYSGDRLIAFLYDNDTGEWQWRENHYAYAPFYDRPWIVEVKGPISWLGSDYPWASLVVSNFWQDLIISVDGLNYFQIEEPQRDLPELYPEEAFDLDFEPGPEFDYMQPHRGIHAFPLPTGGLLMPGYFSNGDDAMLTTSLTWARHVPVEGQPLPSNCTWLDSTGALHSVTQQENTLTVHQSLDGGRSWTTRDFTWANASWIEEWEFHADGAHGAAALNMRVQVGDVDVDLLWQIYDYRDSLEPDRLILLGQGDLDATSGAGNDVRFDFASVAILPDGGMLVSYADSTDADPLFALELELED